MLLLRPPEIVRELDLCIAGQERAKRAMAIAIRNRWRHEHTGLLRANDLVAYRYVVGGPRGCGKTRIVEQTARIVAAPFARVHMLQLAGHADPQQAVGHVLGNLVDDAARLSRSNAVEQVVHEAETNGVILIDGIDRWLQPGEDAGADPLEPAQQALVALAASVAGETRYGPVQTGSIMMFATGNAFAGRAADAPLDLQALFPKRIDLDVLQEPDLLSMLRHQEWSPLMDYVALLRAEGVEVRFGEDAIETLAAEAAEQNRRIDDVGARRVAELVEVVLDDLLYGEPDNAGETVLIDAAYVAERLAGEREDDDYDDLIL